MSDWCKEGKEWLDKFLPKLMEKIPNKDSKIFWHDKILYEKGSIMWHLHNQDEEETLIIHSWKDIILEQTQQPFSD